MTPDDGLLDRSEELAHEMDANMPNTAAHLRALVTRCRTAEVEREVGVSMAGQSMREWRHRAESAEAQLADVKEQLAENWRVMHADLVAAENRADDLSAQLVALQTERDELRGALERLLMEYDELGTTDPNDDTDSHFYEIARNRARAALGLGREGER